MCVALAIRRLVHDPRYIPRLVLAATLPERGSLRSSPQPVFLVSSCLLLAMLFLPAVGPLFPAVVALSYQLWVRSFPFFSVSTAFAATSLTSTCVSACSSQLLRTAAVRLRHVSCNATLLSRAPLLRSSWHSMSRPPWHSMVLRRRFTRALVSDDLFARPRADPRVLFRTLLHVLRVVWWSPSTTLSPLRALRVWRVVVSRARSGSSRLRRHPSSVRSRRGPEYGCDRVSCSLSFGFQAAVPRNLRVVALFPQLSHCVRVATCLVVSGHFSTQICHS